MKCYENEIIPAVFFLIPVFQLFYTTVFGAYSAFLFLRTGKCLCKLRDNQEQSQDLFSL